MNNSQVTVGIVGYGELGQMLASQVQSNGFNTIVTNRNPSSLRTQLEGTDHIVAESVESLAIDSDIVISAVWPNTALSVVREMDAGLAETVYIDLNSISPQTTRTIDELVTDAGGTFLKGTVMDSIAVKGATVPILLAGPDVESYAEILTEGGLVIEPFGSSVERPAALKMCRSMVTKGIMVLFMETLLTAREFDLEEELLESVHDTFADMTPAEFAEYFLVDMADNSKRRHAEMSEVLETAQDKDISAPMTEHTHRIHDVIGANPPDATEYTDMLDALAPEFRDASSSQ